MSELTPGEICGIYTDIHIKEGLMDKPKIKKMYCPDCNSAQVQTKKSENKRWCRRCGADWPIAQSRPNASQKKTASA